jgi:LysR family transcriptional regulator, glycine cleavage system transcriptional activator
MMNHRRPPLADLRAFEAAARHLSFTRAAAELGVTQGAVSQRIRKLEDLLDLRLFERHTRSLTLTNAGETLATAVADGLSRIDQGLAEIGRPAAPRQAATVTVSVTPDFASKWLLPRLTRFQDKYPEIEVRITAEHRFADFVSDGVDLGIRFGSGLNPGLSTMLLMPDVVFPVCSPAMLQKSARFAAPADLLQSELLHDAIAEHDGSGCDWRHWFQQVGIVAERLDGLRLNPGKLAIDSAANGLGVALARGTLIGNDITEGRLARPLPHAVTTAFSYYLVHRQKPKLDCHVTDFVDWLRAEAAAWLVSQGEIGGEIGGGAQIRQDNDQPAKHSATNVPPAQARRRAS